MEIDIGIKQPDPKRIKVTMTTEPEGVDRPFSIWFDGNIIEITMEQADVLQYKLRGCLRRTGTEPSERM